MLRVAEHFEQSDRGRQRTGNEDRYFSRSPLFAVADGMGGAQAGEVASQMAVEAFEPGMPDGSDPGEALRQIVRDANSRIFVAAQEDSHRAGMGTTCTAAYLTDDDRVVIAHVGDSRAYVLRKGELIRLTRDHSLVGELVARGKLTEEQAETHPQRSVITRALGADRDVEVDLDAYDAKADDLFLLCSDGLTSMIGEGTVQRLLEVEAPLEQLGHGLIDAANDAGGRDNITVVLFRLEEIEGAGTAAVAEEATRAGDDALRTEDVAAALRESEPSDTPVAVAEPPRRTAPLPPTAAPPPRTEERPRASERRRRFRIPAWVIVTVILLALVGSGAWVASRAVYFLGTDPGDDRTIVLFRGVPYELPFGIELYERVAASGLTIESVPDSRRAQFTGHKLRSREDAEELLAEAEKGRLVE